MTEDNTTSNDPFEVTTTDTLYGVITYTPVWAMQFIYKGDVTDVAWCNITHSRQDDFIDYGVRIRVNGETVGNYENTHLFDVANTLRKHEVRNQLTEEKEHDPFGSGFYDPKDIANATEKLWKRAATGEFVGQLNGSIIYVQEVAAILDTRIRDVLDAIGEILVPQKRISLNGMILATWESGEKERKFLEETFGHKNMSRSDFGYWACSACGKGGDDYDNPRDYPCVDVDTKAEPVP